MLPVAGPLPGPQPTTPGRLFLVLTATLTAGQAPLPPSWKRARVGGARVTGRGLALGAGPRRVWEEAAQQAGGARPLGEPAGDPSHRTDPRPSSIAHRSGL